MRRRPLALVLTAALIGAVFTALPAKAATEVPAAPNMTDPAGDADITSYYTGQAGPAGAEGAADILAAWFTVDGDKISAHIQTAEPGPGQLSYSYNVYLDADGVEDCLILRGIAAGNGNPNGASGQVRQVCDGDTREAGEYTVEEGPDGTGIHTITVPRSFHPSFADGSILVAPLAETTWFQGAAFLPVIDGTDPGTDYTVTPGGTEPPVIDEPDEPKPPKNPCKKLKGKKKKKCLKKNAGPKPCTAYQPGELGADAETFVVTSAATEEAPMEAEAAIGPGAGGFGSVEGNENPAASKAYYNIQVDPEAAEAGLYVRLEFFEFEDYDMILFNPDGTEAASVGGGNVAPVGPLDGTGAGGHSEQGAEQLDGIKSADCQGYTLQITNPQGLGDIAGALPLKLWLGEVQYDPAAPAKAYVL